MHYKILIADDETYIVEFLEIELCHEGHTVYKAMDGNEALRLYHRYQPDIAILDVKMPELTGLQCLQKIRQIDANFPVIIMTAYASISDAVEAMKYGASDYIGKPFETTDLLSKIDILLRTKRLKQARPQDTLPELVGISSHMQRCRGIIEKIKDSSVTVLLTGESGTGKTMIAKEIHSRGKRSSRPFIHVDCASLPENLAEDELFGHERGAFTGAIGIKKGKFELAEEGDIFLDEIGTLPLNLQTKLLHVLQERCFYRIGGTTPIKTTCRIMAATNEDLELAVKEKRFRKDLFYRLNVVELPCLPLRYRRDDIRALSESFFRLYWEKNREEPFMGVDESVYDALNGYDWPGNIRELENTIESIVVLSEGNRITFADLPPKLTSAGSPLFLRPNTYPEKGALSLKEQEIMLIIETLERHNGNRTMTAKELGISRRTLYYKLKSINELEEFEP